MTAQTAALVAMFLVGLAPIGLSEGCDMSPSFTKICLIWALVWCSPGLVKLFMTGVFG